MTTKIPQGVNTQPVTDDGLLVALRCYPGLTSVNKFGRSVNVDSGIDTDIHDGANASSWPTAALDDRDTWIAPTEARIHSIVSTSSSDTQTIKVFGLTSWDGSEVSEDVTLTGTDAVNTTNSYVIIHRMRVTSAISSGPNVGTIYATAATDDTITAQINPGEGQTQMAVYGIGSGTVAYMSGYYLSAVKGGAAVSLEATMLVNPFPDVDETVFITKHTLGLATDGTSYFRHRFNPYFRIAGPAIIKIQANSSANDTDVSAGFDLILVDKTEYSGEYQ